MRGVPEMASVLVVGAGLAGLSCAWRLQRAGFDVEVLEASSLPGGRNRSERRGEFLLDCGPSFFTSQDRNIHSLATGLNLSGAIREQSRRSDAILRAGVLQPIRLWQDPFLQHSKVISGLAKLRLQRLRIERMRRRSELDPAHPETASTFEGEALGEFLLRTVGAEARDHLIDPYLSHLLGVDASKMSAAAFLLLLTRYREALPQYLEGGVGRLASALAESLSIRYSCEATAIETQSDGARVRYRVGEREGSAVADAVVVAIPGAAVAQLCPKLSPGERGFFEGVEYAAGVVVHLMLDDTPKFPFRSVAFPRRAGFGLAGLVSCHHKVGAAPKGHGLLSVGLTEAAARRLRAGADADIAGLVLDNLSDTPIGKLSPQATAVHRTDCSVPVFRPGALARYQRFLRRTERSPRLVFCGDYLLGFGVESALSSGLRGASELAHCLSH